MQVGWEMKRWDEKTRKQKKKWEMRKEIPHWFENEILRRKWRKNGKDLRIKRRLDIEAKVKNIRSHQSMY